MLSSRDFAGNMLIQVTSRVAAILLGLISVGILSRALGTDGFGEYTTALTFLQLFGVLVDFGLTLTLVVMISEPKADETAVVGNLFTMRLLLGALFYGIAPLIVLFVTPWSINVREAVLVGSIAYLLSSCTSIIVGVFQRHGVMWRAAIAEFLNRAALVLLVWFFAQTAPSAPMMAAASVGANIIWLIATLFLAAPFARVSLRFDRAIWKDAARRSWPIAVSILFNMVYLRGDVFFLSLFRPLSEVGQYGLAYKVIDVLQALPVMFMGLLLPTLVSDWTAGRHHEFREHLKRAFDFFAIIGIPIVIGAQVAAEPITELIAGEAFADAGSVLRVLILGVVGVFFGGMYGWTVVALEKQRGATWLYGFTALLSLVGYLLLIPRFGMWGAVSVTIFSELLIAIGTFWIVRRTTGAVPDLRVAGKAILSSIVMYGALVALGQRSALVQISAGAFVYFIVMLLIGGIKPSTIHNLLPRRIAEHVRGPAGEEPKERAL